MKGSPFGEEGSLQTRAFRLLRILQSRLFHEAQEIPSRYGPILSSQQASDPFLWGLWTLKDGARALALSGVRLNTPLEMTTSPPPWVQSHGGHKGVCTCCASLVRYQFPFRHGPKGEKVAHHPGPCCQKEKTLASAASSIKVLAVSRRAVSTRSSSPNWRALAHGIQT